MKLGQILESNIKKKKILGPKLINKARKIALHYSGHSVSLVLFEAQAQNNQCFHEGKKQK